MVVTMLICEPLEDVHDCVSLKDGESLALFATDSGDLKVHPRAALIDHTPKVPYALR